MQSSKHLAIAVHPSAVWVLGMGVIDTQGILGSAASQEGCGSPEELWCLVLTSFCSLSSSSCIWDDVVCALCDVVEGVSLRPAFSLLSGNCLSHTSVFPGSLQVSPSLSDLGTVMSRELLLPMVCFGA